MLTTTNAPSSVTAISICTTTAHVMCAPTPTTATTTIVVRSPQSILTSTPAGSLASIFSRLAPGRRIVSGVDRIISPAPLFLKIPI